MDSSTWDFIRSKSFNLSYRDLTELELEKVNHPSGHPRGGVNDSSGAAIMCCVFIIFLITVYMGVRIYRQKKYFSLYWL